MEVLLVRGIRHFPYPGIHLYSLFCLRAGKISTRKKAEPCPALSGGSDINQIVGKVLVHMHVLTHTHRELEFMIGNAVSQPEIKV